ncbi:MAG: 2-oxoglutarate dehydrogenase complex dihydrolipoyllysine-residue succinyltransferase [Planctomycetes bacterium]|nr:2-oxoglutarate dehydrogenase complex dihydrolipoyllysine-residue succinyltransferase [Planctomycetota bacterium]
MTVELKVPSAGESITEVIIASWLKKVGDAVAVDDPIVEIDTDKATMAVGSPVNGVLKEIKFQDGDTCNVGDVIAIFEEGEAPAAGAASLTSKSNTQEPTSVGHVMPAAANAAHAKGIDPATVAGSGPGGRVLKEDIQAARKPATIQANADGQRQTERVKMTNLRKKIAERLVQSQQQAAILTTFNEVDMQPIMDLRAQYKDAFTKKYGIKLGFMSFFIKAAVDALKQVPSVNAKVDGDHVIYHNYYDVGVAVGGGKGLVVPVIRNAERLSFAELELTIADFGARARDNKIMPDEMAGGTFTISNGGVYGSMMSTPILNPPQSGILGMHNIVKRAVVINDEIVIRPMMYVALSYDHRIVDGRESVTCLKRMKDCLENPARMLMEI